MKDIKDMTIGELWNIKCEVCSIYEDKCENCPLQKECTWNYDDNVIPFMEKAMDIIDKYNKDKESKDEELALQGYFTLDTIREHINEGSLNLFTLLGVQGSYNLLRSLIEQLKKEDSMNIYDFITDNMDNEEKARTLRSLIYVIDLNDLKDITIEYINDTWGVF